MKWIKASERLPEVNGDIIWRVIGTTNTGGMCYKSVFGFLGAYDIRRTDYENIEWLDESESPPLSSGQQGAEDWTKPHSTLQPSSENTDHTIPPNAQPPVSMQEAVRGYSREDMEKAIDFGYRQKAHHGYIDSVEQDNFISSLSPAVSDGWIDVKKVFQNELLKANMINSELNDKINKILDNQNEAVELVRSFYQVVERKGEGTNWEGLRLQCLKILNNEK